MFGTNCTIDEMPTNAVGRVSVLFDITSYILYLIEMF